VTLVLALLLATLVTPSLTVKDVSGVDRRPFEVAPGKASALFFIIPDCPISNFYAREIHRICGDYAERGLSCALVYTDKTLTDEAVRTHAAAFGHGSYPWIVDRSHALVKAAGITVTPEVVVVKEGGQIAYRGRIDDFYVSWGQSRRQVNQHDLRDALDEVLAGRPVTNTETKAVGCWVEP